MSSRTERGASVGWLVSGWLGWWGGATRRVNRPRAGRRRSRRSCWASSSALMRSWMRSLSRAIASVRSRGSRPRAISYWMRRAGGGGRGARPRPISWGRRRAAGRAGAKKPVLTALVLPGCAPGLRLGGRDVGALLVGDGLEAGADDAEGGDVVLLGGEGDGQEGGDGGDLGGGDDAGGGGH